VGSPYVAPVPATVKFRRFDHGIDYQGNPGQKVVAIGDAVVDAVKQDPGGYGTVVYYTLLNGPHAGQQIFVGHARPDVKVGQQLRAGQAVATLQQVSGGDAKGLVGWTEIGLAKGGAPQFAKEGGLGGQQFRDFLVDAAKTPDQPAAAPVDTSSAPADTGSNSTAPVLFPAGVGTPPGALDPNIEAPGSAQHYLPGQGDVASSWQSVASLPDLSPDTQRLIALSGTQ
jgi:hypothetical protein